MLADDTNSLSYLPFPVKRGFSPPAAHAHSRREAFFGRVDLAHLRDLHFHIYDDCLWNRKNDDADKMGRKHDASGVEADLNRVGAMPAL